MTTQARDHLIPRLRVAHDEESVRRDETSILIEKLRVDDPDLLGLLSPHEPDEWPSLIRRALGVGARGLATMGVGIDIGAIDQRMRSTLTALTDEAERRLHEVIEQGRSAMSEQFDPDRRSSTTGRILEEFTGWRDRFLESIDPAMDDSHTNRFLDLFAALIGPDGSLERRITEALDPDNDGSALHTLSQSVETRFQELRDLVVRQDGLEEGRRLEAARGTAQGADYEDMVEQMLREWASGIGGCIVDRTGRSVGSLSAKSTVGDFVVSLPDGASIVVEAKNQANLTLSGDGGILAELDRALANREATVAVCVSQRDAFPTEVSTFGVYGNRVLVVDDGEGVMIRVALQWARARAAVELGTRDRAADLALLAERTAAIRQLSEKLRGARASLTSIGKGVSELHERLGDLRTDLLDQVEDIERELTGVTDDA